MANKDYSDLILETVQYGIEQNIEKLNNNFFITTISGRESGTNKYIIVYNGAKYAIYNGVGITLNIGSRVWVHIPNKDINKAYICGTAGSNASGSGSSTSSTDASAHINDTSIHVTSTQKSQWTENMHSHSNKTVLDTITAIDNSLSTTSTNPVQNNVITSKINTLQSAYDELSQSLGNVNSLLENALNGVL